MTDRLRSVAILVDHWEHQGVPFGTARGSRMNKAVRKWLNERMAETKDGRKSRREIIGEDAVMVLLKQVAELRK
jgi:phage terminase Nu1 subunit (DNA packaging protein)